MNLKLNNDARRRSLHPLERKERTAHAIKEERRRTGRYIAILVGICLFLLAIYHAWVRRIPIVASLVVPALIMFVYVGWVLYTASRDKHKTCSRFCKKPDLSNLQVSCWTQRQL
ncbi:uncharacterized protein LOC126367849 isoform X2 [Pectinophora gossypiella]|uniref:uncharacterized protein LOC126367849 isoform X2 n=1 Tax=Pectinophora gossypiella TaxID=13191 RepID=UPI00214F5A88|nr:uncharacterized protein LOC126367849 isoform X2 [Pectinophora gossypiella]